ncbi:hypothetical protein LMG29660_04883 [Burkholderia puraquae]|uniref:Uncharacterized protein n=1 Tax=Burkholderia puraquae TaxID=1904757 RepID=A0A6J5EBR4_9BURK|nr:hypothetical protein LMG29660_04883 [Burkholderia puraquae]
MGNLVAMIRATRMASALPIHVHLPGARSLENRFA